jgi:sulfate adenylyltransferase subunit 2
MRIKLLNIITKGERLNSWIPLSEYISNVKEEEIVIKKIRFRTLGDITITGGIESEADSIEKIVNEVALMKESERGNRSDDKRSETAMEDRKILRLNFL